MVSTNKYPFFSNSKNPFKKNERPPTVITKKGFVMFEENGEAYTPPIPPLTTYLLLTENGDTLLTENGDNLEIQY